MAAFELLSICLVLPPISRRRGWGVHQRIPRRDAAPPDGALRGALLGQQLCAPQRGELDCAILRKARHARCCREADCWAAAIPKQHWIRQSSARSYDLLTSSELCSAPQKQKKGGRAKGRQVYLGG